MACAHGNCSAAEAGAVEVFVFDNIGYSDRVVRAESQFCDRHARERFAELGRRLGEVRCARLACARDLSRTVEVSLKDSDLQTVSTASSTACPDHAADAFTDLSRML